MLEVDNTYYMVHSPFEYYPALLIWKSKDLINCTGRKCTLQKRKLRQMQDIKNVDEKYCIYSPANDKIYVVTANAITGTWNDPIDLKINSIDPDYVVD